MRLKAIICLIICSFLFVSCIPSREIERLGIINTRGVDKLDDHQIETTLAIFQFSGQSENISRVLTGKGKTIKGAVKQAGAGSNFELTPEKIQLELYGRETAKQGIMPFLDTLDRDASLPDSMYLAISDTSAKNLLLTKSNKINMDSGQYLHGLIEQNSSDHLFPRVNFQDFQSSFYDIGKDPFLPLFSAKDDIPVLSGIAILKDDKYVGKFPISDTAYFNLLRSNVKDKNIELTLPTKPFEKHIEGEENLSKRADTMYTAFNILKGSSKTKLIDKENLVFESNIKLRLNLTEMSEEVIVYDEKVVKLLEKEVNKAVKAHYEQILDQLQEWNADPFEYGRIYRINKTEGGPLKRGEWREIYPNITVHFNVDARVATHGAVD